MMSKPGRWGPIRGSLAPIRVPHYSLSSVVARYRWNDSTPVSLFDAARAEQVHGFEHGH
jgi:hypothetical protein